jgi:hypothetical protein
VCGDRCIDPAADADNCGACGRSCGGGACQSGDCTPVSIGEAAAVAAHDPTAIFYAGRDSIVRRDKNTGATSMLGHAGWATSMAVDGRTLYYIDTVDNLFGTGTIYGVPIDLAGTPTVLYRDRPRARLVVPVGDQLAWVETTAVRGRSSIELVHASARGGAILGAFRAPDYSATDFENPVSDVVVDGSTVYWLLGDYATDRGTVYRVDLSTPTPIAAVVVELTRMPTGLALVQGRLFITTGRYDDRDGMLLSVATTGGDMTVLATGLVAPDLVEAAPDGTLYWISGRRHDRRVRALAPGALVPRVVQHAGDTPILLVDERRLYTSHLFAGGLSVMAR